MTEHDAERHAQDADIDSDPDEPGVEMRDANTKAGVAPVDGNAVVTLSGGQDSSTCLFYALQVYNEVAAVTFDYDQRHGAAEITAARKIARQADVPHTVLRMNTLAELGDAALTNAEIPVEAEATAIGGNTFAAERGLPSTFVPGRNLLLLGAAAAWGLPRGYDNLVTGVCAADAAGYPDCRLEFVTALNEAISLATDTPTFAIDAPLIHRTKAETWKLADDLGVLQFIRFGTHTCYEGAHDDEHKHDWGFGCGECPACDERRRGWEAFDRARTIKR
jgi:7-cyano-7-deazaguanine synthase